MIEIRTLKNIGIDTIHSSFSKAFSDYEEPFDMTVQQLQYMIEINWQATELLNPIPVTFLNLPLRKIIVENT